MVDLRKKKLKILHVCTSSNGGAGIAAIRLHESLLEYGFDSKMLFLTGNRIVKEGYYYKELKPKSNKYGLYRKLKNYIYRVCMAILPDRFKMNKQYKKGQLSTEVEIFTSPETVYAIEVHPLVKEADIIQLHWVADFLDWKNFFKKVNKPVCWYFHDMNPLLGGLHYSLDEASIQSTPLGNLEEKFNKIKDLHINEVQKLYIQCDSYWLCRLASESHRFKNARSIETIHYSLDFENYYPVSKDIAKRALNIERNKTTILFGADNIDNKRKGFDILLQALRILRDKEFVLCAFGSGNISILQDITMHDVINYGKISNTSLHRLIYSAADIFVMPSRQEAFGQTALESLACGTPVIGFDTGGIPDIIIDGENGILVKPLNSVRLAMEIDSLVSNRDKLNYLTGNARKTVINKFARINQVKEFTRIYTKILSESEEKY